MTGPEPERDQGERGGRSPGFRPSARYSTLVGIAFMGLIVVAAINAARTGEGTILGTEEVLGEPVAEFAVPDIRGPLDGDANVSQDDCETSANPCPAEDAREPACEIDPAGAIRVCDLFDRPLAISFWFTRGGDCTPTQDAFDEVAGHFGDRVNFLSVNVRDDPGSVADIVRQHGWTVPVALDRDGAVSNLYRVGVCPTIVLAYPGG